MRRAGRRQVGTGDPHGRAAPLHRVLERRGSAPLERDRGASWWRASICRRRRRPDGTYPVPDPENPFADPQFPFANPPYAARAYSYVAVAQYEALKTAWYWKYQYTGPRPPASTTALRR